MEFLIKLEPDCIKVKLMLHHYDTCDDCSVIDDLIMYQHSTYTLKAVQSEMQPLLAKY